MAMLCALDWRHYGVIATLSQDQAGGARLVLSHGADELVETSPKVAWVGARIGRQGVEATSPIAR
jgi:hypothetical protein